MQQQLLGQLSYGATRRATTGGQGGQEHATRVHVEAAASRRQRVAYRRRLDGLCMDNSSDEVPRLDYVAAMERRRADASATPLLMLAPMENLADRPFRLALEDTAGGFDEACTEFIRVPGTAEHPEAAVRGILGAYNARELGDVPLGAQIMGCNVELLAAAAQHLATAKQAPRVDLNCGCPANKVTGGGAGSSLLRTPERLRDVVAAIVGAVGGAVPVSVKMRSGYEDTTLFEENLLAAQEGGASFLTLHPRTKVQGYDGRADWELTARAVQLLRIPVVGNGDVVNVASARALLSETHCHALMVGRGAVQDPLLFQRIRASFEAPDVPWEWDEPAVVAAFLQRYAEPMFADNADGTPSMSASGSIGRLKKLMRYIFMTHPRLEQACHSLLRVQPGERSARDLLEDICTQVHLHWPAEGPSQVMLVNHMTKEVIAVEAPQGMPAQACGAAAEAPASTPGAAAAAATAAAVQPLPSVPSALPPALAHAASSCGEAAARHGRSGQHSAGQQATNGASCCGCSSDGDADSEGTACGHLDLGGPQPVGVGVKSVGDAAVAVADAPPALPGHSSLASRSHLVGVGT